MTEQLDGPELTLEELKNRVHEHVNVLPEERLTVIYRQLAGLPPLRVGSAVEEGVPAPLVAQQILPLGGRYQAAWSEQCTRIAQRQGVIQIYLTTAAIIFGFWASNQAKVPSEVLDRLLAWGLTTLTCYSTMLVIMHNLIIQRLTEFMTVSEYYARHTIKAFGSNTNDLFYFHDPSRDEKPAKKRETLASRVYSFHRNHRLFHRLILATILGITNAAAIGLTWRDPIRITQVICAVLLITCIVFLVRELSADLKKAKKSFSL